MSDLRELYQSVILDHSRTPRNFGKPDSCTHSAEGFNPLCGDRLTVYLEVEDDQIKKVSFEGSGCAISQASASMMTECVEGKPLSDVSKTYDRFHDLVTGDPTRVANPDPELGKLAAFAGVREFPMRVKCATLAWHAIRQALDERGQSVSTE